MTHSEKMFEEWWNEQEVFALRGERLVEEFPSLYAVMAVKLARLAFMIGHGIGYEEAYSNGFDAGIRSSKEHGDE